MPRPVDDPILAYQADGEVSCKPHFTDYPMLILSLSFYHSILTASYHAGFYLGVCKHAPCFVREHSISSILA